MLTILLITGLSHMNSEFSFNPGHSLQLCFLFLLFTFIFTLDGVVAMRTNKLPLLKTFEDACWQNRTN